MSKKVFLGVGHGGNDPGASKYLVEKDINLKMALACRDYLVSNGIEVKLSRTVDENDPLTEEIFECNAFKPDLAVDVHNNAGGGDGFEAYYHVGGGLSAELAKNIEEEVKKIGQNSRGCKTRAGKGGKDYYGFIRETVCPAVIVEGVFVDNQADAAQVDCNAFGEAYAKGIMKTLGVEDSGVVKSEGSIDGYLVRVTASALNIRSGAGTNHKVVGCIRDKGVYTIVEEKNGWGKLKSGAGWISLAYTKKV